MEAMWHIFQMYGIGGRLLITVQSLCRVRLGLCKREVDLFPSKMHDVTIVNIIIHEFVEVNARVLRRGVGLKDVGPDTKMGVITVADDTVLM